MPKGKYVRRKTTSTPPVHPDPSLLATETKLEIVTPVKKLSDLDNLIIQIPRDFASDFLDMLHDSAGNTRRYTLVSDIQRQMIAALLGAE